MDRMAPSCSSMPVRRSSTRRSASGSPASRGAAVSARAAEGPLPARRRRRRRRGGAARSALVSPMSASPCRPPASRRKKRRAVLTWRGGCAPRRSPARGWKNNYLIRPIGSRQPRLEAGEALLDAAGPSRRAPSRSRRISTLRRSRARTPSTSAAHQVRGPSAAPGGIAESQRRGLPEAQGREGARGRVPPPAAGWSRSWSWPRLASPRRVGARVVAGVAARVYPSKISE